MKLGLITDIHEHVELLRLALDRFANNQVDQVVVIGNLCVIIAFQYASGGLSSSPKGRIRTPETAGSANLSVNHSAASRLYLIRLLFPTKAKSECSCSDQHNDGRARLRHGRNRT